MKTLFTAVCILALSLPAITAFSADRVVVIPINGKSTTGSPEKLWGQGRPGTTTLLHSNGTFQGGSCTATSGVKFALSKHLAPWDGAAAVCPKNTWVCSREDILDTPCPITISETFYGRECSGTPIDILDSTNTIGWVSDISNLQSKEQTLLGFFRWSRTFEYVPYTTCFSFRVWCCHD